MKLIKIIIVVILFAIVLFLAMDLKRRTVQITCTSLGDFKATKGKDILGASNSDGWYCCDNGKTLNSTNCLYYGD